MKYVGVNVGGSGEMAVRLRPMLVFQEHHGTYCDSALVCSLLFLLLVRLRIRSEGEAPGKKAG
jgi:hypothetical protein